VPLDYGIWLENTDAYVVIRNCLISQYVGMRLEHVANVMIENVTVRGGENSIYIYDSKILMISNCDLGHCHGDVVQLTSSTNIWLTGCKIGDGRYHSVYMQHLNDSTLENCDIYDSVYGIYAESSELVLIRNCNIHDNSDGIYLYATINMTISNCQIQSNEHGVYLDSSNHVKVECCDIRNNWLGVWLNPAFNCEIHYNNFNNTYGNAQDDGQQNNWDRKLLERLQRRGCKQRRIRRHAIQHSWKCENKRLQATNASHSRIPKSINHPTNNSNIA